MTKFYVVSFSDGTTKCGEFDSYTECLDYVELEYAEEIGTDFTIEEYDSEEQYWENI